LRGAFGPPHFVRGYAPRCAPPLQGGAGCRADAARQDPPAPTGQGGGGAGGARGPRAGGGARFLGVRRVLFVVPVFSAYGVKKREPRQRNPIVTPEPPADRRAGTPDPAPPPLISCRRSAAAGRDPRPCGRGGKQGSWGDGVPIVSFNPACGGPFARLWNLFGVLTVLLWDFSIFLLRRFRANSTIHRWQAGTRRRGPPRSGPSVVREASGAAGSQAATRQRTAAPNPNQML